MVVATISSMSVKPCSECPRWYALDNSRTLARPSDCRGACGIISFGTWARIYHFLQFRKLKIPALRTNRTPDQDAHRRLGHGRNQPGKNPMGAPQGKTHSVCAVNEPKQAPFVLSALRTSMQSMADHRLHPRCSVCSKFACANLALALANLPPAFVALFPLPAFFSTGSPALTQVPLQHPFWGDVSPLNPLPKAAQVVSSPSTAPSASRTPRTTSRDRHHLICAMAESPHRHVRIEGADQHRIGQLNGPGFGRGSGSGSEKESAQGNIGESAGNTFPDLSRSETRASAGGEPFRDRSDGRRQE